jgi:hypothetical protein
MKVSWSLAGLLVLGWPSAVAAQPTARMSLTWNGPPGCPSADNVQARVDALLGGEASASSVADVRASGQVERVDSGFRLLLSMGVGGAPSSRVIEARTCDELAGAAAIAIALLARSTLGAGSTPATGEAAPSDAAAETHENPPPEPIPKPETPESKEDPADDDRSRGPRFIIDAPSGLVAWGSLPSTALGLGAGLGIRWKALRASAKAELWRAESYEASGFETRFVLQTARVDACLIQMSHGVELGPCVGAAVERLAGDGVASSVFTPRSRSAVWFSGVGGLFVSLPTPGFDHLRFFAEAAVLISPIRPRFTIDQLGPIHEPALAAPRLGLGCEWIF